MKRGFVVQDAETFKFLAPVCGDVGFVPFLSDAGVFRDFEEAEYALTDHCGGYGCISVVVCNDDFTLVTE